jgi:hypothetical protein
VRDAHPIGVSRSSHLIRKAKEFSSIREKTLTPDGERNMPTVPFEQPGAELILEFADLSRQRRLAEMKLRGSSPKMELIGDRDEIPNQAQVKFQFLPPSRRPGGEGRRTNVAGGPPIMSGWISIRRKEALDLEVGPVFA